MKKITNQKNKGFTIVELIVVMAIIAILILIAVPTFTKYIDTANRTSEMGTADTIFKSAVSAMVEDYTSPKHASVTPGSAVTDPADNSTTLVQDIDDGVDGTVSITVYGYDASSSTKPARKPGTTAGNWEVYIPSTTASGAGVPDATKDVYIVAPDGTLYENGDFDSEPDATK